MWAKRLQVLFSRRIFSPKCQKRGRGGRGVWGEFRRARAFRRSEAEAVSCRDSFVKRFGFCSGDTAVELYNINAMSNKIIAIILLMLVCIGGILYFYNKNTSVAEPVFCTQDVKLCPGGSYVGRTGPKCEFSECPIIQVKGTG